MAKLSKSTVWDKVPQESTLILAGSLTEFLITQSEIGAGIISHAKTSSIRPAVSIELRFVADGHMAYRASTASRGKNKQFLDLKTKPEEVNIYSRFIEKRSRTSVLLTSYSRSFF